MEYQKLLREPSAPFGCSNLAHGLLQDVIVNLRQIFIWLIYVEVIEFRVRSLSYLPNSTLR